MQRLNCKQDTPAMQYVTCKSFLYPFSIGWIAGGDKNGVKEAHQLEVASHADAHPDYPGTDMYIYV
jgi:hypothetical protein